MYNLTLPLTFKLILILSKYKFSLNCFRLCIVCIFIHFLFYSLFQTCSVLQQTWWPHGHRAHPSHPPVRQRERVESTLLRNRSTFSRGTIQLFWFVCSIIHEHQTAGWMLTPATARTGSASSCYSLGSYRPAAAHGRDTLQPLPKTSAITRRQG